MNVSEIDLKVLGKGPEGGFARRHQGRVDWDGTLSGGDRKIISEQHLNPQNNFYQKHS